VEREDLLHPHHPGERAHLYRSHDLGSVEVEVGELLRALVHAWKPRLILETGTYKGVSARYLAEGCELNGFGKILSIERDAEKAAAARVALERHPSVEVVTADSVHFLERYDGDPFDFALLDSDLHARVVELRLLRDRNLLQGIAFIHDTSRLRAAGGMNDHPAFAAELDALGLPGIECPFSRGWRIVQVGMKAPISAP